MSQETVTDYDSDSASTHHHDGSPVYASAMLGAYRNSFDVSVQSRSVAVLNLSAGDKALACLRAVEKLLAIEENLMTLLLDRNASLWQDIATSISEILVFIETDASEQGRPDEYLQCITSLFDTTFLRALLNIREKILDSIPSADSHGSGQIICCVDAFFACCPDFIFHLASYRQNKQTQCDNLPPTLHKQKKEDSLRAACQLPRTFLHFPDLLRSNWASPALKRLALSILFAMFVLRPDLEDCDPWVETSIKPEIVLECLYVLIEEFVCQARNLAFLRECPVTRPLRTAYALAITLFASADTVVHSRSDLSQTLFQPHTSACLLELMQIVLTPSVHQSSGLIRADDLDDAQAILLHWGGIVPWAWRTWDDPRIIGFDTVVILTSNWLFQLGETLSIAHWDECFSGEGGSCDWLTNGLAFTLSRAVRSNPRASLVALTHQLRVGSSVQPAPDTATDGDILRMYRTMWCLSELIDNCVDALSRQDLSVLATELVLVFTNFNNEACGDRAWEVREEIVHCLTSLRSDILEKALSSLQKDISFFTKIANATAKASRMLTTSLDCCFLLDAAATSGLVTLLKFICVFYRNNAAKYLPSTTLTLFSDLLKVLMQRAGTPALRIVLLNCLVGAHGHCQASPDTMCLKEGSNKEIPPAPASKLRKTWKDEDAYNLALDLAGTNLNLAVALASYVVLPQKKNSDHLLLAETWDYLCNALFMLTATLGQADGDQNYEEFLSWSGNDGSIDWHMEISEPRLKLEKKASKITDAMEKICAALVTILKRSDQSSTHILLLSPPTRILRISLEKIVGPRQIDPDIDVNTAGPRVVKICTNFLEKLNKIETDLNK